MRSSLGSQTFYVPYSGDGGSTGQYLRRKSGGVEWGTFSNSTVGLGNVANERQYSANNPPPMSTETTGSGNAVTGISVDQSTGKIISTKGSSFSLSSHTHSWSRCVAYVKGMVISLGSGGTFTGDGLMFGTTARVTLNYQGTDVVMLLFGKKTGSGGDAAGIVAFRWTSSITHYFNINFATGNAITTSPAISVTTLGTVSTTGLP